MQSNRKQVIETMEKAEKTDIIDTPVARSAEAAGVVAAFTVPVAERLAETGAIFVRSAYNTARQKYYGN